MTPDNTPRKLYKGKTYDLLEYRPNRVAVITKDGEFIRKARRADITKYIFEKRIEEVDIGTVEVSLALSAVSALLTSKENFLIVRILAACAFVLSSFGAGLLYFYYLYQKVPTALEGDEEFPEKGTLYGRWLRLFFNFFSVKLKNKHENDSELAYLNILAAFFLVWLGLIIWIIASFLP